MTATITETDRRRRSRRWLQAEQRALRPWLAGAALAGVLSGLATIAQMGLIAWLIHQVLVEQIAPSNLLWPTAGLAAAMLLRASGQVLQDVLGTRASLQVRRSVRERLVGVWSALGPVHLAEQSSAQLANQFVEQVEALDGYYARFLPQMVIALVVPLLIALVAWQLDWLATVFLLLAAPLIPLFMALVGMGAERAGQAQVLEAGRLAGQFLDRVRSLTTLQLFGQAPAAVAGVQAAADGYRRVTLKTLRIAFLSSAVLEFFASVAIAVVAMYVGFGLLGYIDFGPSAQLTLFSGLFVLLLAPEFFQPLRTLAQHYHDRAGALAAADSLAALEDRAALHPRFSTNEALSSPVPAIPSAAPAKRVRPDHVLAVRVADLCLRFPGRGPILEGLSLQLAAGETLLVTGASGAGKSTLLHCLAGFVLPDAGRIELFGRPPGALPVGWMGQRPTLIQGSWRDNLAFTAPLATTEQMLAALQRVGLGALLARQPDGLDTPLGEGGRGLSGGQVQRLALARLWLCDAPVLLLDEPTASLDPESEAEVIQALRELAATDRTLIIATHNPALEALADRRLHLRQGRSVDD